MAGFGRGGGRAAERIIAFEFGRNSCPRTRSTRTPVAFWCHSRGAPERAMSEHSGRPEVMRSHATRAGWQAAAGRARKAIAPAHSRLICVDPAPCGPTASALRQAAGPAASAARPAAAVASAQFQLSRLRRDERSPLAPVSALETGEGRYFLRASRDCPRAGEKQSQTQRQHRQSFRHARQCHARKTQVNGMFRDIQPREAASQASLTRKRSLVQSQYRPPVQIDFCSLCSSALSG